MNESDCDEPYVKLVPQTGDLYRNEARDPKALRAMQLLEKMVVKMEAREYAIE